jgi:aromatic-L-amino-acid decarboxylase
MLSSGLGINGFSWQASPACTELETIVMHWLGVMSGLPKQLLPFEETNENYFDSNMANSNEDMAKEEEEEACDKVPKTLSHWGGGVLLGSASECVLVSMLAARTKAISKFKREHGFEEDGKILTKLVAYTSKIVILYLFVCVFNKNCN